jgi:hypothetical protein
MRPRELAVDFLSSTGFCELEIPERADSDHRREAELAALFESE